MRFRKRARIESIVTALVQAVEAGVPVLGGCARLRPLHRSTLLSVDLWRCVEDGEGLRAERAHAAPVLTVLLSGASALREGGRTVIVEPGTALLAHPDLGYRAAHPFGCGDTGCHVRPSPALLEGLRLPRSPWTAIALSTRAHLRFRLAVEGVALCGGDGLELEEACLSLLAATPDLRVLESPSGTHRRHAELVDETKTVLLRRFADALSVNEIAREVGVSPFHLARLFRRHTGFSLHGYRTRIRLLHALDRIEEARGALTDLALELGFSSQSHLTDAFRRAFGVPPGALARPELRSLAASGTGAGRASADSRGRLI
jgi:AraC family transcriptional regulator